MADYTSDEIQTAVEKVVRSSIRRPYGSLGNRDVQTTFNDMQDAAAGVLMLYPNSPFYIVYLGTLRLAELIEAEQETVAKLVEAIDNLKRNMVQVENLAPLSNARVALQALEGAAASRGTNFRSIEDIPAFRRYDSNLQQFLDTYGKNIRSAGEIAPTPQQARAELAGLISQLQEQHQEVVEYTAYLAVAIEDYNDMQLPALVSASVISKSRQILSNRVSELEDMTPKERLASLRDTMLDLMAGRAAVRGLGALKASTLFALLEGTGEVFADEEHPATPAMLLSEKAGPYAIFTGENELYFEMEGPFYFTGVLPGSFLANVTTVPEPYEPSTSTWGYQISAGSNDKLVVRLYEPTGYTDTTVTIPSGNKNALQVANAIEGEFSSSMIQLTARAVVKYPRYIGTADVDATVPASPDFTLPAGAGDWVDYGVAVDDFVTVTTGGGVGSWYQVTSISGGTFTATWVAGGSPTTDPAAEVEVGPGWAVRIEFRDGYKEPALVERSGFGFPADPNQLALDTLGLVERSEIYCRSTAAETIAQELTASYNSQQNGQPRLAAETLFNPIFSLHGRSDPDRPTRLVAYKLREDATVSGTIAVTFTAPGVQEAGVAAGDRVVIRVSTATADINVAGTVQTPITEDSFAATMDQAITAGPVTIEVGPNIDLGDELVTSGLSDSEEYLNFLITGSENQDGSYSMARAGQNLTVPFEFELERPIPVNRAQGGLPQFFEVQLGLYSLIFSSTDTTLDSKTQINTAPQGAVPNNSAHDKFFVGSGPFSEVGTTKYFLLPEDPKSLQLGDSLQLYETVATSPDSEREIVGLELDQLLIEVDPELAVDFGSINMSNVSAVPFARIRLGKQHNYDVLQASLEDWLDLSQADDAWFTELYRLVNPLVSNENPTLAAVSTAKNYVSAMSVALSALATALDDYDVDAVTAVDTLLQTYRERNADRGVDVLLQGRFSDFFGITLEGMSYGGRAREVLREVNSQDLPVSSVNREQTKVQEMLEGEFEDVDYSYDLSDVQGLDDEADIPGDWEDLYTIGR